MFSNEERFDLLACFIKSNSNSSVAERMYLQKYPERSQPNRRTFSKLVRNLKTYGSFKKPVVSRKKSSNEATAHNVLSAVIEDPGTSVRRIAQNVGIPKSTTHFILRKQKLYPYKYRICQGLRTGDFERRRSFCEWYTRKCQENYNFPYQIIWSDESMITNNGIFNRRNVHYWSETNQHLNKTSRHQNRFGFNIWAGILGTTIVGPFFTTTP